MIAYWLTMTKENEILMTHEMHAKDWSFKTLKTAEAVILLDFIAILQSRVRNTNNGKVDVHVDKNSFGEE